MKLRRICMVMVVVILAAALAGCAQQKPVAQNEPAAEPVTLTVVGGWEDCPAIDAVGRKFTEKYPNCTILYEFLQDYEVSLEKRLQGDSAADLFFTSSIQESSPALPYALELNSCEGLDLSETFDGLKENYTFREDGKLSDKLYALPLGAEIRGMYVNLTLLKSLNIETPTNQETLLAACETLKQKGYIPVHGNPGNFAQWLLYPWVCNLIVHADDPVAAHNRVNTREPGFSEMFREPCEFMYTLIENYYYDYKTAQTDLNLFTDASDISNCRDFLNIMQSDGEYKKVDDIGQVAFMPSQMSKKNLMKKVKDDYHSSIEYVFMPSPIGKEGGFAYMSPAHGIAVNKTTKNLEWSIRFFDFLFHSDGNELFADEFSIIPNTKQAFEYITNLFDVPQNRISELGQVTFDYGFYQKIAKSFSDMSKGNNPKYMQQNDDGTTSLYPVEYYMERLEEKLQSNED